ncbi:hypothetical protein [Haloprofundus halobius]|uniref:hypothetical protein n=1 Tax=Haloprofundus halobius TaxID=2876194 RepID=UPI001CCA6C41|nr:hypothetical protein [Haloprofundus halobius]
MERRGLLGVVAGVAIGWGAASSGLLGSDGTERDATTRDESATRTSAAAGLASTATGTPARTSESGAAADEETATAVETEASPESTPTPDSTSTAVPESTPTATPEPENLQENLDVHTNSTGVGDDPGDEVSIVYVIRNGHEFAVDVSFQATLRLADGEHHRTTRFTRIDAGSLVSGKILFDAHEQRASGWGFSLRRVDRASE